MITKLNKEGLWMGEEGMKIDIVQFVTKFPITNTIGLVKCDFEIERFCFYFK